MSFPTIAAAILAGGRARRFGGRDKSRLMVEGRSIIVRQIEALQPITQEIFIVAHTPERFADLRLPVATDRIPGLGAMGGILTALESTPADRVLVIACDLPFLTADLLRAVADRVQDADAAWVATGRGPEPLLACYARSALGPVREAIADGHLRARDLAQRLRVNALTTEELITFGDPDRLLANLNTPDDHARVQ